jgi:hypothetical protein
VAAPGNAGIPAGKRWCTNLCSRERAGRAK